MLLLIYGCKEFLLIPYLFHYNLCYPVSESEEILMEDVKFSKRWEGKKQIFFAFLYLYWLD